MTVAALLDYNLPLFNGLSPEDFDGIAVSHHDRTLRPWEILFNQQDTSREVCFLLSGALLAVYWTEDGREIIFSRFATGAYLGELAALDGGDRSLAIVARKDTKIAAIPQDVFLAMFNNMPAIRDRVTHDLVSRVRSLTARNLELTTLSVEQRVASYLIRTALEHNQLEVGGVISDAPTHADIAATIGSNREMVSRTLTQLGRRGAIKSGRKRIEIRDPDILSQSI